MNLSYHNLPTTQQLFDLRCKISENILSPRESGTPQKTSDAEIIIDEISLSLFDLILENEDIFHKLTILRGNHYNLSKVDRNLKFLSTIFF